MRVADVILGSGSLVLLAALIPALRARAIVPRSTSALTSGVLATFAATYASIGYVYAAAVTGATAGAWLVLLAFAWEARP